MTVGELMVELQRALDAGTTMLGTPVQVSTRGERPYLDNDVVMVECDPTGVRLAGYSDAERDGWQYMQDVSP